MAKTRKETSGEELFSIDVGDPFSLSTQLDTGVGDVVEKVEEEEEEEKKLPVDEKKKVVPEVDESEEEETEEEEEEEEEEFEEEEEESDDEEDLSKYSSGALVAKSFQSDGIIPSDVEVKEDLSGSELKELLRDSIEKELRPELEYEYEQKWTDKGYNERLAKYVQLLLKGGSPQAIPLHAQYERIAKANLQDDAHKEAVIRAKLKDLHNSDEDIQLVIDNIADGDELTKRAADAQKYFGKRGEDLLKDELEAAKKADEAQAKQITDTEKAYKKIIQRGAIGDSTLSDSEKRELEKYFLQPSILIEAKTPEGDTIRQKITPFKKWLADVDKSPEAMLELALYALKGKEFYTKKAEDKVRDQFLDQLDSEEGRKVTRRKKRKHRVETPLMDDLETSLLDLDIQL